MELSKTGGNHQKTKDILAETLERISDAFVGLDSNSCYTYVNKKAGQIFNRNPEDIIGKHIWTEFPEGVNQPFYEAYNKAMQTQQYIYLEDYYAPYDKWFESHIYPSPDGLTIFFKDITQKKKTAFTFMDSEEKYRTLVEQASDGIFVADENGLYVDVNESACQLSGYTKKEFSNLYIKDLVAKEDEFIPFRFDELRAGKTVIQRRKLKRKDGKVVSVEISAKQLPDGKLLAIVRDLTDRIKAEQELEKEKELSDKIINSLPGLFYLADPTPKMLRWNKAFEKVSGYTAEELEKIVPITLFDAEDQTAVKQSLEKTYKEGFADVEARVLSKNGEKIPFFFTGVGITYNGQPAMLGTGINIAERINAEEELIKSNERYSSLLNNLDAGVVIHAADTSIITSNPKASQLLGLSDGQLKGKLAIGPNWSFMDDKNAPLPVDKYPVNQIIASKQPIKNLIAAVNRPATKDMVWLIVNGFPVFNSNNEITEVVISFIDITEHKKVEFEKAKERKENNALINSTTDLLWSVSNEYTLIAANNAFVAYLKEFGGIVIKPGENILKQEYFPEEYLQYWKGFYSKGLTGETVLTELFAPQANSTDLLWFEIKIDPIIIEDKITGIACAMRNITERKKAADEIIKANERYELIGNATNDGLWDWDLETQKIWGNKTHQQLYGLTMQDAVPDYEQWKQSIHPDDREGIVKGLEQALASGSNNFIEEYRFNKKNKEWIYVYGRTFIERNKEGKAIRLIGSMMDITESKKAALFLKESEEKFRTLVEQAGDGIFEVDLEGNCLLEANLSASKLTGYSIEELKKMNATDIVPAEELKINPIKIEEIKQGNPVYTERIIKKKDGTLVNVEISAKLMDTGKVISILRDITQRKNAEKALQNAEQRLQFLLSSTPAVIYSAQAVFPFAATFISDNITEQTGYLPREFVGVPNFWSDNIHPDDKDRVTKELTDLFVNNYHTHEYRFRIKEGSYLWMHDEVKLIVDAAGKPLEMVGYWININERKIAEEAIKESEEKYRTLVEQASDAIFIADENGKFTTVNSSACKLSGFTENELMNKTIYDFAIMEDLKKNPFHFKELKEGKTMIVERIMKVKDGVVMNIEVNAKLLSDGKLLTFVRDISERKKSQQALAESENRLRTIYNTEPECIKILGPKGELIEMNPAGLAMIEADDLEQVKGHSVIEIINKPYRKAFLALTKNVFKEKPGQLEFEITGLKGTSRWLETHAVPLKNIEGKIISLLGVTRDITARKNAEAEIIKTTEQLRQLTTHLQTIREEERKKIGREIHDELGQQLTAIKMDVVWIDKKTPEATAVIKNKLKNIIGLLDGSNQSVRRILTELRPDILDEYGLLEALKWQGRQFTANTDIPVKFVTTETDIKLKEQLATCIYRIYQESLTNIMRHAAANKVLTSLKCVNDTIILTVEDDGKGFNTATVNSKNAFGILGMRERIFSVKGKFQLISSAGNGTKITITLPYTS